MRYLKKAIGLLLFLCCVNVLFGQNVVTGKYKGHIVKMKYYKGSPDDIQYLEYGLVTELNKTVSRLESEKSALQKELNKLKGKTPSSGSDDSLQMRLLIQERDILVQNKKIDSLTSRVQVLNDSLTNLRRYMVNREPTSGHITPVTKSNSLERGHFGISYRMGIPVVFNALLSQKDLSGQSVWDRRLTLSHQIGLYWGSRSLARQGSFSLGLGFEYSRVRLSAGIGHLSETLPQSTDNDGDSYTAYLTYNNVIEDATLHYLNIPLTMSVGQPLNDRVSGYGQITLAPSFCVGSSLNATGMYNSAGHYSQLGGVEVDLDLNDPALGLDFGDDILIGDREKSVSVNRFVLLGRISGGFYLPLCNTHKGKTSQWVVKLGLNVDLTLTPIAKALDSDESYPDAVYRLNQYNILAGKGCRFVNPSLEVGLLYIFK